MRTTKLFATILVAGLIASACQQDPDYVLPAIKVESEELNFAAETEQTLAFTATRDWRVQDAPEWVTVVPDKGSGSQETQRVRVSVAPNTGYNRSGEFVLTIGLDKARVVVSQPGAKGEIPVGSGTKEDPYTVTGVLRYIATLGADVESPQDVYVKGKIATVTEAFSAQYGNGTFEMLSDSGEKFTFYRGLFLGNKKWTANDTQIKVDDEVVICGKVINFKGNTPETQQNKAYIYSLNGETQGSGGGGGNTGTPSGTGTQADPYNVAGAIAAVANLTWTDKDNYQTTEDVYVKGKISRIATQKNSSTGATEEQYFSAQFGNASFYISEDGSTTGEFYVYRVMYLGNDKWKEGDTQIKVGDEVIICGKLMNYQGKTPETVANKAYIYSLNGVTDSGNSSGSGDSGSGDQSGSSTATGNGTLESPYNAAGANAAASKLTWTDNDNHQESDDVYIKGKICEVKYTFNAQYGTATFYISDDGSNTGDKFQCYSVLYLGNKKWVEGNTQIKVDDEVIICGKLVNYQGKTPETSSQKAYIYSLNGNTE